MSHKNPNYYVSLWQDQLLNPKVILPLKQKILPDVNFTSQIQGLFMVGPCEIFDVITQHTIPPPYLHSAHYPKEILHRTQRKVAS